MSPQPAAESVTRRGRGRRPRGKSGRVKVEEIESTETPVKAENAFHDTALMQAESSIEKNILKETESSITEEEFQSIELSIENNRDAQAIEQQVVPMEGTECTTQQDVDDGSESGESDTESEPDEVEKIVDVKVQNNILKFRVRWVNCRPSDDTWEPEESFTGSESKMLLDTFREENRERIEELLQADKQKKTRRGRRSGPRWEYVAEPIGKDAQNELRPRELNENDPFYGQKAASTTGELKRLFDPSHKNSVTELVLTTTDPTVKITRSQMKSLIGSREASRSNTPTPGVLLTDDDHCHGSPSPVFSQVEPKISARNTARRGRIPRVTKGTTRKDASGKRKRKADIFEKDKVLLDETMNSQTLSAIKSGRLASTDNINKLSITDPQDKVKPNNLDSCTKPDASLMVCDEEKNALITAPPLQLSRRRATHLLPCEISLNEKVSIKMLGEMLREMEVRHYGDEERYGCSQETFNADILSGQYMRVRRTVAHNVTSAPRLASWNDPYGANLLHLLCRSSKCDDKHTIDDIATMLCNLYPMVLKGRDSHGRIPLHDAVEKGQVCRVIRLLSFHSPVNVFDRRGNSPLIMAYGKNHAKMMRVLLMAGANFTALENSERKRPDSQRKKRAYDVLTKHARTVQSLMSRTRRKVYRCVTEYRSASPSFTAPFSDGPELTFQFHSGPHNIPSNEYGYILFIYVISNRKEGTNWQARCWGGLRLAKAPQLNGRSLTPTTSHQRNNHMMFHAVPCLGANVLTIRLGDTEVSRKAILGAQIAIVKRVIRETVTGPRLQYPILEQAPMIGPI